MGKKTFESALAKLEKITLELEAGELPLETSLKKFDEGMQLVNFCSSTLEEARSRVELLTKKNNTYETIPFEESSIGD